MAKVLFIPLSVAGAMLAGFAATKVFEKIWALIDDQEPPDAEHREASWAKLLPAAALQGAIFRTTRAVADRGARTAFYRATGTWPGEDRPDPE
jgi:hypothetical protein